MTYNNTSANVYRALAAEGAWVPTGWGWMKATLVSEGEVAVLWLDIDRKRKLGELNCLVSSLEAVDSPNWWASTGRGSLAGLRWILLQLKDLQENGPPGSRIKFLEAMPSDLRRKRAYRWLEKIGWYWYDRTGAYRYKYKRRQVKRMR